MPEITYTRHGDYLLPDIILSDPPDAEPLTKYGMIRKRYLKEHCKITYGLMLTREEIYPHCRAIQRKAQARMDALMEQLTQRPTKPLVRSHGRNIWRGCTTRQRK
ncbi:MAG: TnpV protein [Defluviitaleaceae bacterium]|nr:TnpV protein [Defluviitaleaceae bacterium]